MRWPILREKLSFALRDDTIAHRFCEIGSDNKFTLAYHIALGTIVWIYGIGRAYTHTKNMDIFNIQEIRT
jgi:hypothetical protein